MKEKWGLEIIGLFAVKSGNANATLGAFNDCMSLFWACW